MNTELLIKMLTGGETRATMTGSFDPDADTIQIHRGDGNTPESFRLSEITYIQFLGKPSLADSFHEDEFFEDITTITGDQFHLRLKRGERHAQGVFGFPVDLDSSYKSIFFTHRGLRKRSHEKPLGEVLQQQGAIDQDELTQTLAEQTEIRKRRVGEIIADQSNIIQQDVESAIENANRNDKGTPRVRVGDILIEAGLVTRDQVEQALAEQESGKRQRIGTMLVNKGLITEDQLLTALAQKFGLKVVNLEETDIDLAAVKKLAREQIEKMQVLPIRIDSGRLIVATSTPTDPTIAENLRFATNTPIELVVCRASQIGESIAEIFEHVEDTVEDLIDELDDLDVIVDEEPELEKVTESDSKVINLVNRVLLDAHKKNISDIHFEPGMGPMPLRIRYRKDGVCYTVHQIAAQFKAAIISRIKIISKLDIAEHRRPQSGKIMLKHGREKIEYRVEITPTIGGQEDAVLRVLTSARIYPLDRLGFSASNHERFQAILQKPYGIILCVGPTGSGKTTTLHSALSEINTGDRKIWTAEDPVEITQEGLRQVQVFPKIGFTFEEALRSFLRADPDVVMIGEMRDPITAKTAIGASLTGHLVFSTLHTNNAPETVTRLIEMGMDPFNFADAMLGIIAQRLARRFCEECKEPYHPSRAEYDELVASYGEETFKEHKLPKFSKNLTLMKAVGCETCEGQGYSGRIAVHELLVNSAEIKKAIKKGAGVEEIGALAAEQGMTTLRQDGIQKIFLGITDLQQVNKVSA